MPFQANPRRDAHATIAGFFYQVNITLLRWLGLQQGQHLELECGEDIDTVEAPEGEPRLAERRLLEQLKVRTNRTLTLRSPEAVEAISNFCEHRSSNPDSLLQFRYLTTADTGVEQGWTLPENGVETWTALHRGEYDDDFRVRALREIRRILKLGKRPERVSERAWSALQQVLAATDDDALGNVVFSFEWALGYGDPNQSEADVLSRLVRQGHGPSTAEAGPVYKHLFAFVFRLLTKPGMKMLTTETLEDELAAPSIPSNQRGILNAIKDEIEILRQEVGAIKRHLVIQEIDVNALKQTVELIGKSYGFQNIFALSAATLSMDVPELVMPRASRRTLVNLLLAQVETIGAALLLGEPGSGKTQLLRLAIDKTSRRVIWLNIPRGATEAQANLLIDSLVRSLSPEPKGGSLRDRYTSAMSNLTDAIVVIEDIPRLLPGGPLALQLETLAACLTNVHSVLLLSSYYQLPASMGRGLGKTKFDVPRLTEEDLEEILRSAGAPESFPKEAISRVLITVSGGLPVLAMAAVRYLSDRGWAFSVTEVESLIRGEFAADYRKDAGTLLQATIPDAEERELLIRMSLAIGSVTREDIARVAKVPKAIALPGEKVNRAIGLWLQDTGNARFLLSPLITSDLGAALDPRTRMGVHYILALQILARRSLTPFDVATCVHHLRMAEAMATACIVLIQAYASILEMEGTPDDELALMRIPVATVLSSDVDLNLRLYLSALDIVVRLKQGREIDSVMSRMDRLLTTADHHGWGTVLAAGTLAIHLVWKRPTTANRFLLLALAGARTARLPNGSLLPVGNHPLEGLLWVSVHSVKSDDEADSWLETITLFTPEQMKVLRAASEMAEVAVTILCDGYWRRVYLKPEAKRNWTHVTEKLDRVDRTARAIEFDLLEAASIRTHIMLLAEWQHLPEEAVKLATTSLERFASEDCRFLILEVTGRQLSYGGKREEAIKWLGRALSCKGYEKSLWRRNVLITLAELYSKSEPKKAAEFTAFAVDVAKGGAFVEPIFIETLLEHVIALWNAGEEQQTSDLFGNVLSRLFAVREDTDSWKGLFYRTFQVLSYFSEIAQHGKESKNYQTPEQGRFLASNDLEHTFYKPEQQSYIWIRQAMLADGVGDVQGAACATWKVFEYAEEAPAAWADAPVASRYGVAATLLADDFDAATKLALTLALAEPQEIARRLEEKGHSDQAAEFRRMRGIAPTEAQKSTLRVIPWVPVAIRLSYLQLHGRPRVETESSIADIERIMAEKQPEALGQAMRESFLEDTTWDTLQQEGYDAMRAGQYARALTLLVGAMQKAPIVQSLYLQAYLAENFEQWFGTAKSIYREIIAPLFRAYWEHAFATSTEFRTGVAYTTRQFELIDGTPNGTRKFLRGMRFCIGATLPEPTMNWLNRA